MEHTSSQTDRPSEVPTSRRINHKDFQERVDAESFAHIASEIHQNLSRILTAESQNPRFFKVNQKEGLESIEVIYSAGSENKEFFWWMKVNNTEDLQATIYAIRGNYSRLVERLRKTQEKK